jgi:hypothetical protein
MDHENSLEKGFITAKSATAIHMIRTGSMWPMAFKPCCTESLSCKTRPEPHRALENVIYEELLLCVSGRVSTSLPPLTGIRSPGS